MKNLYKGRQSNQAKELTDLSVPEGVNSGVQVLQSSNISVINPNAWNFSLNMKPLTCEVHQKHSTFSRSEIIHVHSHQKLILNVGESSINALKLSAFTGACHHNKRQSVKAP